VAKTCRIGKTNKAISISSIKLRRGSINHNLLFLLKQTSNYLIRRQNHDAVKP
jgi:hypothetical protein